MTLLKKALGVFAVLAVITIAGQYLVVSGATSSSKQLKDFKSRAAQVQTSVLNMIIDWYTYDDQNNMYILVAATSPQNHSLVEATYAQGIQGAQQFQTDLAKARAANLPGTTDALDKISQDFVGYDAYAKQARADQLAGKVIPASILITVTNANISNQLMSDLTAAQNQAAAASNKALAAVQSQQSSMQTIAVIVGIITVVLLMLLALLFWRSVLLPLREVGHRMEDIAQGEGDLTARIANSRSDEIGALARAFNLFIGRIQGVMVAFSESIVALLAASEALGAITVDTGENAARTADTANGVSGAAEQVASNISAVAAGAEQMSSSIAEIARNAADAAEVAANGRQKAEETNIRVRQLASSSAEIDSVVRLISAIAEQTNLLALNATIEAARAGDAGKGFAVVASEVKNLAAETARATNDVTSKVASIQTETAETVDAIADIASVIEQISDIQGTIAAAVEEQNASTNEITRWAGEVAANAGQITTSVSEVATAVGATSVGVSASNDTIAELAELSSSLNQLVTQFKIG